MTLDEARVLKQNIHTTFDSKHGQETMKFIERIGSWWPRYTDSNETNDVIARDANRKLIATLKNIMNLSAEHIVILTQEE